MAGLNLDRVLVVGAGRSGRGAIQALADLASEIVVFDVDPEVHRDLAEVASVSAVTGDTSVCEERFSLIVVSPGVPVGRYGLVPVPGRVVGELELGFWLAAGPIAAVTGTNGKTTVATLAHAMLGEGAVLCGNAGTSFAAVASTGARVFVVEASSFQLAWSPSFTPRAAAFVNFSADHLDWHGSLEAYFAAKASMFGRLGTGNDAVLNLDDDAVRSVPVGSGAQVRGVALARHAEYAVEDGALLSRVSGHRVPVARLVRSSPTDLVDALMAFALAESCGADGAAITEALASFRGLPHRQEMVGVANGVRFVDDSKATTPEAAAAAILSFSKVVLLAGGRSKQVPLTPVTNLADRLRAVVAIGESQDEVVAACHAHGIAVARAASMKEAVELGAAMAAPGDTVLLAPAAASYDWYRNYEERGEDFAQWVRSLPGFEEVRR